MKNAAIYARYSPGRDRDQTSTIEAQIAMCREKAAAEGLTIDEQHIYIDRAISGASLRRPAFQVLLGAIEAGRFPSVLLTKDDKRLFRNEREAGELIEWIWASGVEIHYCLVQFGDPRLSDEQWFLQRQFHLFAELERRKKAKEVHEHQKQNALAGYSNGGLPPYGYRRREVEITDTVGVKKKKLKWEIDPAEADAVALVFSLYERGHGSKAIADELTRRGYKSRRNKPINKYTVLTYLKNPYPFAGCLTWNTRDRRNRPRPKSEWILIRNAHPAIIDLETAERIFAKTNRKEGMKREQVGKYMLSGLLVCGVCGERFLIHSDQQKNSYFYVCGSRRRRIECTNAVWLHQPELEKQISAHIIEKILAPGFLEAYYQRVIDAYRAQHSDPQTHIRFLETQIATIDRRIDTLIDALADKRLPQTRIADQIEKDEVQKEKLLRQLEQIKAPRLRLPDLEAFRSELKHALETDPETKKTAIRSLVKSITVASDAVLSITYIVQTGMHVDSATGNRTPV